MYEPSPELAERIAGLIPAPGAPIRKSWSADLEHGDYAQNRDAVIRDSLAAVAATAVCDDQTWVFVNLVTPAEWGDPETYLAPALSAAFGHQVRLEAQGQCGCGGYVLRAWRLG